MRLIDRLVRLVLVVRALATVRRPPPLARLTRCRRSGAFVRIALVPAGRNLGVAVSMLPRAARREATVALLAARVLDAFEDLSPRRDAPALVLEAAAFLCGAGDGAPALEHGDLTRPSERLDALLVNRIELVRGAVASLPRERRTRVARFVMALATAMASQRGIGLRDRRRYGRDVLGSAVTYGWCVACESADAPPWELCHAVGELLQMANDLRDDDAVPYAAQSTEEFRQLVYLSSLLGGLAGFTLASDVHRRTASRGTRAATAYMLLSTIAFFCAQVGGRPPVHRRARLLAAVAAATSPNRFERLLQKSRASADDCIARIVVREGGTPADGTMVFSRTGARSAAPSLERQAIVHAIAMASSLPDAALAGECRTDDVVTMMLADHLTFEAVAWHDTPSANQLCELGTMLQAEAAAAAGTAR